MWLRNKFFHSSSVLHCQHYSANPLCSSESKVSRTRRTNGQIYKKGLVMDNNALMVNLFHRLPWKLYLPVFEKIVNQAILKIVTLHK